MGDLQQRRAAIDLGTNSFLLTVAEVVGGEIFSVLEDHMIIVRLGEGVDEAGSLCAEAMERGIEALKVFREKCEHWQISPEDVRAVGTSALRDASNRDAFVLRALAETGFDIEVVPGKEEALHSFRGAVTNLELPDGASPCLLDIGGGSTEIVWAGGAEKYSLDIGVVRARERYLKSDPPTPEECSALVADVKERLAALPSLPSPSPLIAVAGTPTTLVAVAKEIDDYDGSLVHGERLSIATIQALTTRFCTTELERRKAIVGLHPKRADLIISGAMILTTVMVALGQIDVLVSDRGLRYGLLLDADGPFGGQ